jgi:hypothetical protein
VAVNALPIKRPAAITLYPETVDGRPYVNCMPYASCSVLRWMAYDVPANYGKTIRTATGVPVNDHLGHPQGINFPELVSGLTALFPTAPIEHGAPFDAQGITDLLPQPGKKNRNHAVFAVAVPHMTDLSDHLRRWCGMSYKDGHAFALGGKQIAPDGIVQWWWMDMMADTSKGFAGEWVNVDDVYPALEKASSGLIKCVYGVKGSAIP